MVLKINRIQSKISTYAWNSIFDFKFEKPSTEGFLENTRRLSTISFYFSFSTTSFLIFLFLFKAFLSRLLVITNDTFQVNTCHTRCRTFFFVQLLLSKNIVSGCKIRKLQDKYTSSTFSQSTYQYIFVHINFYALLFRNIQTNIYFKLHHSWRKQTRAKLIFHSNLLLYSLRIPFRYFIYPIHYSNELHSTF